MVKSPDVIVVGAGPAGATVARELAAGGLAVLLLDKNLSPRTKLCAGGLTYRAVQEMGILLPESLIRERCSTFRAVLGSRVQEITLSEPFVFTVDRREFDAWLLEAAQQKGVVVREGEEVLRVELGTAGPRLVTTRGSYNPSLVIGADGVLSRVAAALGQKSRLPAAPSICAEISLPEGKNGSSWCGTTETHWGYFRWGYGWVFPKGDRLSVGLACWDREKVDLKALWPEFIHGLGLPVPAVSGHLIPVGGGRQVRVGEGVILLGDAAGYADPLTGEGILYAFCSARLAAATVLRLRAQGLPFTASNLKDYEQACYQSFGRDLAWALALNTLARSQPELWRQLFFTGPEWFSEFLQVVRGKKNYRQFAMWALSRLPLGLFQLPSRLGGIVGAGGE